jgi:hypothetical protein
MFRFRALGVLESGPLYGLAPIEAVLQRVALRNVCRQFLLAGAELRSPD